MIVPNLTTACYSKQITMELLAYQISMHVHMITKDHSHDRMLLPFAS